MTTLNGKRRAEIEAMTGFILEHGLAAASLRPLAGAAATSDRMLIYHYGSKDRLIGLLLDHIAATLARQLNQTLPDRRAETVEACLCDVLPLLQSPDMKGFMRLWHEIVAAAAGGQAVHKAAGQRILDLFEDWLGKRLPLADASRARAVLVLIEGMMVFHAVDQDAGGALDLLPNR